MAAQNTSTCPKVFPSDIVTTNTPASVVLKNNHTSFYKNIQNSVLNYSNNECHSSKHKQYKDRIMKNDEATNKAMILESSCIPKSYNQQDVILQNLLNKTTSNGMSQSMFNSYPSSYLEDRDVYTNNMTQSVSYKSCNKSEVSAKKGATYLESSDVFTTNNMTQSMHDGTSYKGCNKSESGAKKGATYLESSDVFTTNNMTQSMYDSSSYKSEVGANKGMLLGSPSPCFNRNLLYRTNTSPAAMVSADSGSLNELVGTRSSEDLTHRQSEAECKRNQALEQRLKEQEEERIEQARLEEILNMCAEYEKQVQNERVVKPPFTPNRIKTNGSLPRDKRSPLQQTTEETVFKFDTDNTSSSSSSTKNNWCSRNNLSANYENILINKLSSSEKTNSGGGGSPYENIVVVNKNYLPQSPRTKIKTYVGTHSNITKDRPDFGHSSIEDYDFIDANVSKEIECDQTLYNSDSMRRKNVVAKCFMNDNLKHELMNIKKEFFNGGGAVDFSASYLKEKNINELSDGPSRRKKSSSEDKQKVVEGLLNERSKVQCLIMNVKKKIADIEMQEEEIMRELELEKSLLSGEHKSESCALYELEEAKRKLQERAREMESHMQECRQQQELQQQGIKAKLQTAQLVIMGLEKELTLLETGRHVEVSERLSAAQESLENEKKHFEDLEFHHLEEEANMLVSREELQREIQDLSHKIELKKSQILELEGQKTEVLHHSSQESKRIEKHLIKYLRDLEEFRLKLKTIDNEYEMITGHKVFEEVSDGEQLSEDDSETLKKQLENKIEHLKLLKLQLASLEKENKDPSAMMSKSFHEVTAPTNAVKEYKTNMSQSFHESYSMDSGGGGKITEKDNKNPVVNSAMMSKSFHEVTAPTFVKEYNTNMSQSFHECYSMDGGKFTEQQRLPSQDDIDRISKVTSEAPIDLLYDGTGSLGRKTIESFKTIERNRQLHLEQQGSHVINEERKRVLELKRKVQDEVKAQWEERRQRECNSINSVGSDDSVFTNSGGSNSIPVRNSGVCDSEEPEEKSKCNVTFSMSRNSDIQSCSSPAGSCERPTSDTSDASFESDVRKRIGRQQRTIDSPQQQRPLTLYLPVRGGDALDLRRHIAKAGHPTCGDVALDASSCRGYLTKMGTHAAFRTWRKRWFVFDRENRTFIYYSSDSEKKIRGGTYFQDIAEVYLDHLNSVKSPNPQLTFVVKTYERSYHLIAPSAEAMRIWIDVIFTGAEGYQEFDKK